MNPAPEPVATPDPAPPRSGWGAGLLRGLLASLLGLVLTLIALAGWLGGTESGLRVLCQLATGFSGGLLQVEAPAGYLLGEWRLAALKLHTTELHLEVRDLAVDWHPAALARNALEIHALSASRIQVATAPSPEPAALPASLELPLAIALDSLRVDRLLVGTLEHGQATDPDLELTSIVGALTSDGRHHRFTGLRSSAAFGQISADGEIDGRRPYPLQARAQLATRQMDQAYLIEADATGELAKLDIKARAEGAGMDGEAALDLTPFASLPLKALKLQLRNADPARFHPDAPKALLDIQADLTPSAPQPAAGGSVSVNDWVVAGPIRILNRRSASHDAGGLPVESLAAELRWAQGELAASGLDLRLPGGGRMTGSLRWRAPVVQGPAGSDGSVEGFGQLDAALKLSDVDARRLDKRAVSTRISGPLTATADAATQSISADLSDPQLALRFKASHRDGVIQVEQLSASARAARLQASGRVAVAGEGSFDVRGELFHFDPHAFVSTAPTADLNSRFKASGRRSPRLAGRLQFELDPSRLDGKALSGHGDVALDGPRLSAANVSLDLAGNHLKAQGAFGRVGDALAVHADAPALAALGHGLGGRLTLDGVLRGSLSQPAGEFELAGSHLSAAGFRVDEVGSRARLEEGKDGATQLQLRLVGLYSAKDAEPMLRRATLDVAGRRSANTMHLSADGRGGQSASLALAGVLGETPAGVPDWHGRLESFSLRGGYTLDLLAPATLTLSTERVSLGRAELRGGGGGIYRFEETRWESRHLLAKGSARGVQVGLILDPATREVKPRGDSLYMGAEWDLDLGEQLNGLLRVYREKGDVILIGDAPVRLGLDDLQLTVSALANRLAFGFSLHGANLGSMAGAGTALAERSAEGSIRLVPDAPLLGSVKLDMPSIAWAGPLADQNLKTGGSLKAELSLTGTPAHPESAGRIHGQALSLSMADQGLSLSGGSLEADFNRDRLHLTRFDFVSPNQVRPRESRIELARLTATPGTLGAQGEVDLASGEGKFTFKADRLPLLQRPDQWMILSGEGGIASGWNSAELKGRLKVDAGYVELSRTPPPSLGDDVVVLNPAKGGKEGTSPFRMYTDLSIDMGTAFYVDALGLDTRLVGEISLKSSPGRPLAATGEIRTLGGVYEGYGQKLSIERGIITFNGPVANPSLNVIALRKNLAVEAGVGISGTARRPIVRLVSEPNVPDPEKLGWIVLGRPPDQGSGGEMALLLPAAQALLGNSGQGMSATLANALSLDEISFGSSADGRSRVPTSSVASSSVTGTSSSTASSSAESVPGQVITLGKRLSAQAMLSFEQSVTGASSVVKLSYQLTRRIAIVGRAGSENAVDALFSLSFH